jgi:hypothetical protein
MRTRMSCCLVLLAALWAGGCDNNRIPGPPSPTAPAPAVAFGTRGAFEMTMTVTADAACTQLPLELRTRTYQATVQPVSGGTFTIALGGADFWPNQRVMWGTVVDDRVTIHLDSWEWFLDDLPIVETIGSGSLELHGTAQLASPPTDQTVSASFGGTLSYCSVYDTGVAYFRCTATPVECQSTHHELKLSPR